MRKRSSYRPRPVLKDAMAWIQSGFQPVASVGDQNVTLRLRNHIAFNAVLTGTATVADLNVLIAVSNMATALARKHGVDWREEIRSAADAIEAIQNRYIKWGKVQSTSDEVDAISLMMRVHDAQLDAARIADLDTAIALAKHGVKRVASV